jgi:hypothetical protein
MPDFYDFDMLEVSEIDWLITWNYCTEKDVVDFYNNEWWRDSP